MISSIPLDGLSKPIRVLIVDLPGMLRGIVRETVEAEADMVIAGEVEVEAAIPEAIDESGAEIVIIGAEHPVFSAPGPEFLAEARGAPKLFAVGADGRSAFLYALKPVRTALGELSPQRLVQAIRAEMSADGSAVSD